MLKIENDKKLDDEEDYIELALTCPPPRIIHRRRLKLPYNFTLLQEYGCRGFVYWGFKENFFALTALRIK